MEEPSSVPVQSPRETVPDNCEPTSPGTTDENKPVDIRQMTIKNLDTGEEFIIGENDPDFEFDTFEIGGKREDATATIDPTDANTQQNQQTVQERISWLRRFFNYIYGSKQSLQTIEEKAVESAEDPEKNKSKTPFTKLSSFKIRRELGRGAFGRVLLAEAKTDGKLYALKIISKKNMRSSDKRQAKAERDILFAMTLKAPHPFTSGLKFAFQSENNLYLGMDYIPGGNLRELIKKFKYLPEDWVRFYAAELILAISHLHSLNVLYRDIKPHNVMIDARGHLILIDFGLSKQEISHPRGALSLVGTPDYSAPEVLRTGVQQIEAHNRAKANGKKKKHSKPKPIDDPTMASTHIGYGKAADWWSLGIMIYEMLAGKPTFRGVDLRETYQRILYAKLEFNPEERFSESAMSLLSGLINRDPAQRLGAWDNPPKDIMDSPFFDGVEWDAIYERRQDGPFVPELPAFLQGRKSSITKISSATSPLKEVVTGGSRAEVDNRPLLVFSPPPYQRMNDESKEPAITPATYINENKEGDGEEESSDEESDEEANIPGLRDSVFITSQEHGQNRLPDWSYIDEAVLAEYLTQEAKGGKEEEEKVKCEKKKKKNNKSTDRMVPEDGTAVTAEANANPTAAAAEETLANEEAATTVPPTAATSEVDVASPGSDNCATAVVETNEEPVISNTDKKISSTEEIVVFPAIAGEPAAATTPTNTAAVADVAIEVPAEEPAITTASSNNS